MDKTQLMKDWLLRASVRFIAEEGASDFDEEVAKEVYECMNDDVKFELIKSYFNALMFTDHDPTWFWKSKTGEYHDREYMLGFENVSKMFSGTEEMFPSLTRFLTICVYS